MSMSMSNFEESAGKHVQLINEDEEQGRSMSGPARHQYFATDSGWFQPTSDGILSRPLAAGAVVFFTLLNFILAVAALSNANSTNVSSNQASTKSSSPSRFGGMDCTGQDDMIFGSEVHTFEDHSYQLVGLGSKGTYDASASLSFMDALRDAEHRCYGGKPGYLANVESPAENSFLLNLLKSDSSFGDKDSAWLGAGDMRREGTFSWFTKSVRTNGVEFWSGGTAEQGGAPVDNAFTNWHADEPNSEGEEDCVQMYGGTIGNTNGGFWNDVSCYATSAYFLVEYGE